MNNNGHSGDNPHRQQPSAPTGHPSLPHQFQQHFQQHPQLQNQDPQIAYILAANAAAARNQQHQQLNGAGPMGAGNTGNSGGFGGPGGFGNAAERGGPPQTAQSAAASLFEEQILQRASALRAEALMQQQQSQQQQSQYGNGQQAQLQLALQAFQQQHGGQNSSSAGSNNGSSSSKQSDLYQQQQEAALLARATALQNLGLANGPAPFGGSPSGAGGNPNFDHLREQLDINALMRHRQQQQVQQQQSQHLSSNQQRAFGLEQELERVRQVKHMAGGPGGANPILGNAAADPMGALDATNGSSAKKGMAAMSPSPRNEPESVPSTDEAPAPKNGAAKRGKSGVPRKSPEGGEPIAAGAAAAAAAAASNNNAKTKEELRKNPGTVIVPCRARGMPMDHNFISAYFVISEDAKHGENLVCSYYACRNGGIKFRYCAYCMAPVAKRNFSRRHDHGMSKKKGKAVPDMDEEFDDDDTLDEMEENIRCQPCDKESLNSNNNSNNDSITAEGNTAIPQQPQEQQATKKPKKTPDAVVVEGGTKRKRTETTGSGFLDEKRRSMWNDLLDKRPRKKDPAELSSWLNEVLATSDVDFPLEQLKEKKIQHPLARILLNKNSKPEDEVGCDSTKDASSNNGTANKKSVAMTNRDKSKSSTSDDVVGKDKQESSAAKKEMNDSEENVEVVDSAKDRDTKTPLAGSSTNDDDSSMSSNSSSELLESNSKKLSKQSMSEAERQFKEEDGFSGSFADWRDRKKGKSLKKGSGSLRK